MPDVSDGLVRRILAEPRDALARLVFADWLEESGDPGHAAWAAYIRLRSAGDATRAGALGVEATLRLSAAEFARDVTARLDLLPYENFTLTVGDYAVPRAALGRVGEADAGRWRGLPLAAEPGLTLLGLVAPRDRRAVDAFRELVGGEVAPVRVPGDELAHLVARTFTRAIALVSARPAEVTVTPQPAHLTTARGNLARSYTPDDYLTRLLAEARARGALAVELVAHAEEYRLALVFESRPVPWMPIEAELGRELAEGALRAAPEGTRVLPRASRHGWGVRVELQ